MRDGYKPLYDALEWMRKNKGTSVSTRLGGIAEPGIHTGVCIEYKDGGNYVDYIFQTTDKLLHKERVWKGRFCKTYQLNKAYQFELVPSAKGTHRIDLAGEMYKLMDANSEREIFRSYKVGEIYQYTKDNKIRLIYLNIRWSKEVT